MPQARTFVRLPMNHRECIPNQVPPEIPKPDYADDGVPKLKSAGLPWTVEVKNEEDILGMRAAGRVARWDDVPLSVARDGDSHVAFPAVPLGRRTWNT